jgi:transcriptional regulator with XRE-family HTH domain
MKMDNSVKNRIKNRRIELGLNQAELAQKAGLKAPAISQYESGARSPSFEALRKLSHALNVTTDYLMLGVNRERNQSVDKKNDIFLKVLNSLSVDDKEKLLDYAIFLAAGRKKLFDKILNSHLEYANLILDDYSDNKLPLDVFKIANSLGIKVFHEDIRQGEGLLLQSDYPVIILDEKIKHVSRIKFTLATLIGHYIIPWHLKPSYICRKYTENRSISVIVGESTLLTDEIQDMEAQDFAASLLIPNKELQRDFVENDIKIENLKKLADTKYEVSLFALLNRLVDFAGDKYAVIQSENYKIMKTFAGKRPLIQENVHTKSIAASFFESPSTNEEVRNGHIPASYWLLDANEKEVIFEQSIFNPDLGKVLTLLTLK